MLRTVPTISDFQFHTFMQCLLTIEGLRNKCCKSNSCKAEKKVIQNLAKMLSIEVLPPTVVGLQFCGLEVSKSEDSITNIPVIRRETWSLLDVDEFFKREIV